MDSNEQNMVTTLATLTKSGELTWTLEDGMFHVTVMGMEYYATPYQLIAEGLPISDNGLLFNIINK